LNHISQRDILGSGRWFSNFEISRFSIEREISPLNEKKKLQNSLRSL
jgi:hypothetical protein